MPMIVSLNPKIHSLKRWMVRDGKRPHVNATPHKAVIAHRVRFAKSPFAAERGFGGQVAFCAGAQGYPKELSIPSHCFRITFDGFNFIDPDGNRVAACDTLYFLGDGKIFAEQNVQVAEEAAA